MRIGPFSSALLAMFLSIPSRAGEPTYDIVIYGGTSGGISAAVQAARLGRSVVLIEPGQHLGGLTSGGLGATDIGNKKAIGGIAREFYRGVRRHYDHDASWKYDYPDGDYATREKIFREHLDYHKGLMWTLANHPRVPEKVRRHFQSWGLARDEFLDHDNWPHQLYIREARRLIGPYVMIEQNCRGTRLAKDSVGLAAYTMDSHNTQRYVTPQGHVRNEGDVQVGGFPPYPISYMSIIPKARECTNLLVPVCLSASHISYGSIRMEPVFMVLGQSAATAASLAIADGVDVQKVDYPKLRSRLLQDGQVLDWRGAKKKGKLP